MTELMELLATKNSRYDIEIIWSKGSLELHSDGKAIGVQSIINRSSKWLVAAFVIALILWRHDAMAIWATFGCVTNARLSVTLKHIIKQERLYPTVKAGPGMPSSHAQFIFFSLVFLVLSIAEHQGVNRVGTFYSVLAFALGSYLSWLRVSQRFHTKSQVVAGAVVGTIFALLWFKAWDRFIFEAFVSLLWVRIVIALGSNSICLCPLCCSGRK